MLPPPPVCLIRPKNCMDLLTIESQICHHWCRWGQSRFLVLILHAITILFFLLIVGNERAVLLFLFFQFVILLILGGTVRSCCVFWRKKKLQDHGLGRFLDKRVSACKILHPAPTSSLLTSPPHQMPEVSSQTEESIRQDDLRARGEGSWRSHQRRSTGATGRSGDSEGRSGEKAIHFLQPRQGQNRFTPGIHLAIVWWREEEEPFFPLYKERERDDL